ncbi:hypothetical protein [Paenibacillus polymyxa]|uniref:hypothetical protein n=1 Tax=Paenibacillus polymyxa TaxID=1406 RepID=UPI0021E39189|nr:hypothetical protein [Paenibacillus polymyxa]
MATDYTNRMDAIFESWEYHLFEKLGGVDRIVARIQSEAALFGIPYDARTEYINKKLVDMIDQIAEKREAHSQGSRRKAKKKIG